MITYDKPYTATAHIHSLDGAMDEITVLGEDMVGIPFHAVYDYVNKIIERGYKAILAENSDDVLKFKDIDENEDPEELSEEEMKKFDSYVDEDTDELPTVSKIVGTTDDDEDCTELLNAESAKAFDKEVVCILSELFDGEITLA